MFALGIILSVVMGATLGLLGGGGSILAVPILIYVLGVEVKSAIATSLLVVAATSAASLLAHARAGNVRWRIGALFGAVAMVGSYAGGRLAAFVPGPVLLFLFGAMMIATSLAMLRSSRGGSDCAAASVAALQPAPPVEIPVAKLAAEGAALGVFTGMVGAGGGFLVVPVLAVLGGLPMRAAVGTSLLVIAMNSLSGFTAYVSHVSIDAGLAAAVVAAAVIGALLGARLNRLVSPARLRVVFAWFVLAMAAVVLGQQVPGAVAPGVRVACAIAAALAVAASAVWWMHQRDARREHARA